MAINMASVEMAWTHKRHSRADHACHWAAWRG